jgi:hypothetical protein
MPVVVADVVPSWAGALDVVIAHTDDPYDDELAVSLDRATRYGATVVLSAPPDGPVASSVAGRGVLIPPRVVVPPEMSFAGALTAGILTASTLGTLVADVEALADRLDGEAERCHAGHESFVNPAKGLALRMAEHTPLLWGLDQVAVAVAHHAAYALGAHAGLASDVAGYRHAAARPALYRAAQEAGGERDIFADPDDSSAAGPLPRVLLLAVRTGPAADAARYHAGKALPAADVLAPADEIEADDAGRAAVLALRFELAAVYLGLASGTTGGQGPFASVTA